MGRKKKKNSILSVAFKGAKVLISNFFQALLNIPGRIKRNIISSFLFLLALIVFLGFFNLAGKGGERLNTFLFRQFGYGSYLLPLLLAVWGLFFLWSPKRFLWLAVLFGFVFISSISAIITIMRAPGITGGEFGEMISEPVVVFFGELVAFLSFLIGLFLCVAVLWYVFEISLFEEEEVKGFRERFKGVFSPSKFKVLEVEPKKHKAERKKERKEKKRKKEEEEVKVSTGSLQPSLPPLDLLDERKQEPDSGDIEKGRKTIKKTFDNFEVDVKMVGVNIGPTVTQYTLKPPKGVRLSKITGLSNNLALALAAHPVRIEAPIPGRSLVGVEVPNKKRGLVRLRGLLAEKEFKEGGYNLGFPLGEDVAGRPVFNDLARLPHLLVAGATGTGKTVFLNSFIVSLLYQSGPDKLRFILVDPKRVEFSVFKGLPHLLCPVISDAEETVGTLTWLVEEMERRFKILSTNGSRNIYSYNEKVRGSEEEKPIPYIVLVIDELADLMVARGKELENKIVRIAQMARAVGIHLVVATQRPSVEVITGLIKANITTRISFQLPTQTDSRTVLDMSGAEKLLGAGDMLFISPRRVKPRRIQGAFVSEGEVEGVAGWIEKEMAESIPSGDDISLRLKEFLEDTESGVETIDGMKKDPLYEKARKIVLRNQKGSASLLQRRLRIGYVRAARILDMLEAEGIVGPSRDSKARRVLADEEELDDLSDIDDPRTYDPPDNNE